MALSAIVALSFWTSQSAPSSLTRRLGVAPAPAPLAHQLDGDAPNPSHYGPPPQVGGQCLNGETVKNIPSVHNDNYVCAPTGCSSDSDCPSDLPFGTRGAPGFPLPYACDDGMCYIRCVQDDDCGMGMNCELDGKRAVKCVYSVSRDCYYIKNVVGKWVSISSSSGKQHVNYKVWTDVGYSLTHEQEWGDSVTTKTSAGFEFEGLGASVHVEGTTSESIGESYSPTFSVHSEVGFDYDFDSGVVWQWHFDITSPCGRSTTSGHDLALTPSNLDRPCCLPGMFVNITDPTGGCKAGTPNLCDGNGSKNVAPCLTKECLVVQH